MDWYSTDKMNQVINDPEELYFGFDDVSHICEAIIGDLEGVLTPEGSPVFIKISRIKLLEEDYPEGSKGYTINMRGYLDPTLCELLFGSLRKGLSYDIYFEVFHIPKGVDVRYFLTKYAEVKIQGIDELFHIGRYFKDEFDFIFVEERRRIQKFIPYWLKGYLSPSIDFRSINPLKNLPFDDKRAKIQLGRTLKIVEYVFKKIIVKNLAALSYANPTINPDEDESNHLPT